MKEITGEITSRKNPMAKAAASLNLSREKRRELSAFLAEGARLTADAAESGVKLLRLFYTAGALSKYRDYLEKADAVSAESYLIGEPVAELLSATQNSQGVFAWCCIPEAVPEPLSGKTLVLENIQDPSNLGAMLRTAEALGIGSVLLCGECCDRFSPKCLRASMGAVFRVKTREFPGVPELSDFLKENGYSLLGAVPAASARSVTELHAEENTAVAIGNEGNGLSRELLNICDTLITIPMKGRAESLNAAAAAAILMWEFTR